MKENFVKLICEMYDTEEGLEITNCTELSDGKYELDFIESCGAGCSSVGSFVIEKESLEQRLADYQAKPIEYDRNSLSEAIDMAWDKKRKLLIYPEDMNLIVVDVPREEHCYLSHRTHQIESRFFDSKEEFEKEVISLC